MGALGLLRRGLPGAAEEGSPADGSCWLGALQRHLGWQLSLSQQFPLLESPQGHAWFSAPVPKPGPCPLAVPPCQAIALSPAWLSDTMATTGTVSSPVWCPHVQAQAMSQCQRAPCCPQGSVPSPVCPLGRCWFLPPSRLHLYCLCPFLCRQLELFWLGRTAE